MPDSCKSRKEVGTAHKTGPTRGGICKLESRILGKQKRSYHQGINGRIAKRHKKTRYESSIPNYDTKNADRKRNGGSKTKIITMQRHNKIPINVLPFCNNNQRLVSWPRTIRNIIAHREGGTPVKSINMIKNNSQSRHNMSMTEEKNCRIFIKRKTTIIISTYKKTLITATIDLSQSINRPNKKHTTDRHTNHNPKMNHR